MNLIRRMAERFNRWVEELNAWGDAEDRKWDHMFGRLWETRQREMDALYNMNENLPRYGVQSVGGGWDLWVVFDRTKGHYASAHSTANWVARFRDDMEGHAAAVKKAEELNAREGPKTP